MVEQLLWENEGVDLLSVCRASGHLIQEVGLREASDPHRYVPLNGPALSPGLLVELTTMKEGSPRHQQLIEELLKVANSYQSQLAERDAVEEHQLDEKRSAAHEVSALLSHDPLPTRQVAASLLTGWELPLPTLAETARGITA